MMCVYKITNPDGKIYIGKTTNYKLRCDQYRRLQSHTQLKLNDSFLKYGFNKHIIEVVKKCDNENALFKYECYYMGLFNSVNNGLNIKLPDTPSNLMRHNYEITVQKKIKYELSSHPHYVWTKDDLCFNIKTGRRIRQVYKNGMIGYCINGKFKSLKSLRPLLRKPITENCPF